MAIAGRARQDGSGRGPGGGGNRDAIRIHDTAFPSAHHAFGRRWLRPREGSPGGSRAPSEASLRFPPGTIRGVPMPLANGGAHGVSVARRPRWHTACSFKEADDDSRQRLLGCAGYGYGNVAFAGSARRLGSDNRAPWVQGRFDRSDGRPVDLSRRPAHQLAFARRDGSRRARKEPSWESEAADRYAVRGLEMSGSTSGRCAGHDPAHRAPPA